MTRRANDEWLIDLRSGDERQSMAVDDLRAAILQGLPYALKGKIELDNTGFRTFADSVAQKTLLYMPDHLNDYDGRCAFTTWVLKFAVHQALLELRLQRWQAASKGRTLPEITPELYEQLAQNESWQRFHQILEDELTQNQRTAIGLMMMLRMPKEEVARYLGMELRDYFKMIHDARLRLKRRLEADGLLHPGKTVQV
jgi:DNA-directed RNA polymerase specialized sigma24 family protein